MKKINKKGFTLIELLVVVAIIGLLSTMAVIALGNARQKARDARRQSDLKIMQTAVELYVSDNGAVPNPTDGTDPWDAAANSLESILSEYLPGGLPEDPSTTARKWVYCWNVSNANYLIATTLEQVPTGGVAGDLDSVSNWTVATECIESDGVAPTGLGCSDSVGQVDTNGDGTAAMTAVCLGQNDAT
jgi:prepilin-type N-terminal cleavage/methylation domain-containing protein